MPNVNNITGINLDMIWPVGSYYWTSENINPNELFGGTWEQIKDRFILAAGDAYQVNQTGGKASHVLTWEEMPRHAHRTRFSWREGTDNVLGINQDSVGILSNGKRGMVHIDGKEYGDTLENGLSNPHNNMPPYKVAYCWHRIA